MVNCRAQAKEKKKTITAAARYPDCAGCPGWLIHVGQALFPPQATGQNESAAAG